MATTHSPFSDVNGENFIDMTSRTVYRVIDRCEEMVKILVGLRQISDALPNSSCVMYDSFKKYIQCNLMQRQDIIVVVGRQ